MKFFKNLDKEKIKNKILKIIKSKAFIIVITLIILDLVLGFISRALINKLPEQSAADRWSADGKMMAQVSVFFTEDQMIDTDFIKKMEYVMESKMTDAGIVEETDDDDQSDQKDPKIVETQKIGDNGASEDTEAPVEDTKLYSSCYSAQGLVSISFEGKTADNVTAIGTYGDFFLFHPLELVSGSYYNKDALMKDQIVIDEDLSWQLFGSSEVVGQMVTIGDIPHYVSGVVKRQEGKMRTTAGQQGGLAYISYDSLCKYGTILSGRTEKEEISEDGKTSLRGGINCYEVVMPSPVDGIVKTIVKESTSLDDRYISVVDNSDRFSAFSMYDILTSFGTRSMWNKAIFYPYWENLARGYEDILVVLFTIRWICKLIVICMFSAYVVYLYRHKKWTVSGIVQTLSDKKYDFEVRQKQKKEERGAKERS